MEIVKTKSSLKSKKEGLRDYQVEDKKSILEALKAHQSIIYSLPTGGGKSVVAADLIDDYVKEGKRIFFTVHRRKLLKQMQSHLDSKNIESGFLYGKDTSVLDKQVAMGSINTAQRSDRLFLIADQKYDVLFIDEAHRAISTGYNKLIEEMVLANPEIKIIGLTATPYRLDKKDLSKNFQLIVESQETTETLIQKGYLANYRIYSTPTHLFNNEVETNSNGDFRMSQMSQYMRKKELMDYAIESYKRYADNKQMLVYCVDVDHARATVNSYVEAGYTSIDIITGKTPEGKRNQLYDNFESGDLRILVSVETMTEGVDLPMCSVIQSLRPTKSLTLYLQMIGRGMRPYGDEELIILDNSMNYSRLGTPITKREWSLSSEKSGKTVKDKSKVLVKIGDDGKYHIADEAEDVDFGQIIEMDFGALSEQSSAMIELAEKSNKNVISKHQGEIADLVIWIMKGSDQYENWKIDKEYLKQHLTYSSGYHLNKIKFIRADKNSQNLSSAALYFNFNEGLARLEINLQQQYHPEYSEELRVTADYGKIAGFIYKERKHISKKVIRIAEKKTEVTDLQAMKQKMRENKEAMNEKKIADAIEQGKSIKLMEKFNPSFYNSAKYNSNWFTEVIIRFNNQSTLLVKNRVSIFGIDTSWYNRESEEQKLIIETNYMPKERLMEIIKSGYEII